MARLLGQRQTKGAATAGWPNATAPHLDSTGSRLMQCSEIYPPESYLLRLLWG